MRLCALVLLLASSVFGTARTWTGLGANANWSTVENWSPNGALGTADTLTFDSSCTNCASTIDGAVSVTSITFASTYANTTTGAQTITLTGNFTFSGGTLALTGSTLVMSGTSAANITCAGNLVSTTGLAVQISKTGSPLITILSSCAVDADISGTATTASITVNSGATLNPSGATALATLIVAGTYNVATSLTLGTSLNVSGTLTATGLPIVINGTAATTITCAGNLLTNTGASTITISKAGANTVIIASSCTVDASVTGTTADLTVNSGATFVATGAVALNSLSVAGTFTGNTSLTLGIDLTVTGTLTLTGIPLAFNGNLNTVITCAGNLNSNTGASSISSVKTNLMTIASSCAISMDLSALGSGANASITINSGATLTPTTDFALATLINSGTFNAPSLTTVRTNFTSTGTFTPNSGTVTFNDAAHTIAGSTTFNNFTMATSAAARILTFTAGTTQTIAGTLTLNGLSGKLLTIKSSSNGTPWTITATYANCTLSYLSVQDSTATNALNGGSTSSGVSGNTGWTFSGTGGCPLPAVLRRHTSFIGGN